MITRILTEGVQEAAVDEVHTFARVPGLGNITATSAVAGPSSTRNLTFIMTGLHLARPVPAAVLLQARQSENVDHDWPDQFAVGVVSTSFDRIVCRIRRLDENSGWGQALRIDALIVESAAGH